MIIDRECLESMLKYRIKEQNNVKRLTFTNTKCKILT